MIGTDKGLATGERPLEGDGYMYIQCVCPLGRARHGVYTQSNSNTGEVVWLHRVTREVVRLLYSVVNNSLFMEYMYILYVNP